MRCSDRDRGGLVSVIKAPDHRTYTQAMHGVTNRSLFDTCAILLRAGHQGSSPTDPH